MSFQRKYKKDPSRAITLFLNLSRSNNKYFANIDGVKEDIQIFGIDKNFSELQRQLEIFIEKFLENN